jgi:hypothetical protein
MRRPIKPENYLSGRSLYLDLGGIFDYFAGGIPTYQEIADLIGAPAGN